MNSFVLKISVVSPVDTVDLPDVEDVFGPETVIVFVTLPLFSYLFVYSGLP